MYNYERYDFIRSIVRKVNDLHDMIYTAYSNNKLR